MAETDENAKCGCEVCAVKCWTMDGCLGDTESLRYLCTCSMPCSKGGVKPPKFMSKDAKLPFLISLFMGLQHALAMIAGIATSGGFLIANDACLPWQRDGKMCDNRSWLISTAWICSGMLTLIQVFRAKVKGTPYYLGTGMISVMGTSFTFLPIAREMTMEAFYEARSAGDPTEGTAMIGYGKFLGTCLVASLFEVAVALLPRRIREKLFPPLVVGIAVMMIGAGLIGAGIKYLGGGVFCGENMVSYFGAMYEHPFNYAIKKGTIKCNENGDVGLVFGSPEYVFIGIGTIAFGVVLQIFGSPFLKSTFIFWSLVFGSVVAAIASKDGNSYWDTYAIEEAPAFTFFWAGPHGAIPIGFDIAYFLPILICYWVTAAETVGDVQMTAYYSRVVKMDPATGQPETDADADELTSRIQGGLLADGVNSMIATLCGSPPNTTFSQNNGVIALTQCASRSAGFSCGAWLIFFGLFGKIGAVFSSIPICVVGGVVLQCFCMVFVAGISMLSDAGVGKENNRRASYIAMIAIAFGVGVALEPQIFDAGVTSPASFYHANLGFNYGIWPKYMVCNTPLQRTISTPAKCAVSGTDILATTSAQCATLGGTFTAQSDETVAFPYCQNDNGMCCGEWNKAAKSLRTAVIVILKTPYCIAPLIALVLHLIIPYDKEEEESNSGGKSATVTSETASA